jgi:hypothetical protein
MGLREYETTRLRDYETTGLRDYGIWDGKVSLQERQLIRLEKGQAAMKLPAPWRAYRPAALMAPAGELREATRPG